MARRGRKVWKGRKGKECREKKEGKGRKGKERRECPSLTTAHFGIAVASRSETGVDLLIMEQ
jgi:hypothetical protein